jgi:hypothetical protein
VPVQPAAVELLRALAPVLDAWGRWYVFEAQAVTAYGVPRLSADVDVTVVLTPDDPESFASAMATGGFVLRVDDADFVRRTRVMPFLHGATAMPLDVVLGASGLEQEFADRAVLTDIGGVTVPVIERRFDHRESARGSPQGHRRRAFAVAAAPRSDRRESSSPNAPPAARGARAKRSRSGPGCDCPVLFQGLMPCAISTMSEQSEADWRREWESFGRVRRTLSLLAMCTRTLVGSTTCRFRRLSSVFPWSLPFARGHDRDVARNGAHRE